LFTEDFFIDLDHFDNLLTSLSNDFLIRHVIGISISNTVTSERVLGGGTFGRPILGVTWKQVDRRIEIPSMLLVRQFRRLSGRREQVPSRNLYIWLRCTEQLHGILQLDGKTREITIKKVSVIVNCRDNSKGLKFLEFRFLMLSSNKINLFILKCNSLLEKRNPDTLQLAPPERRLTCVQGDNGCP
jgi:hypothetical protein